MLKDSIIYFLAKFFPAILSFVVLFIYLNYLPPEDYGLFSLILVSAGLINILSSQWIRSSYLRYKYVYRDSKMYFKLQLIVIIFLIALINIALTFSELSTLVKVLFNFIVTLILLNDYYVNYFRANIQPKYVLVGTLIKNIIYLISLLALLLITSNLTTEYALIAFIIGLGFSSLFYSLNNTENILYRIDRTLLKKSFNYGLPITISFALGVLLQNIDKYMITYILGFEENGNYSMGYDLMHNSFYMIMSALAMASLPRILKNNNFSNFQKPFDKYLTIFTIIVSTVMFTLLLTSKEISAIFLNQNYNINQTLIIFIILATLFHGIKSFIYDQAMQLLEKTKFIFIPSLIAVLINITINLLFLKEYGTIIAALSSLIAFIISALITGLYLRKFIVIKFNNLLIMINLMALSILFYIDINVELNNVYVNFLSKFTLIFIMFLSINILLYLFKEKVNEN